MAFLNKLFQTLTFDSKQGVAVLEDRKYGGSITA